MIVVPQTIIGTEQTRKYIYVLNEENKAVRKYVTLGGITDDKLRVIKSGLSTDDRIIVGNLHLIQPGAPVTPIDTNSEDNKQEVES